MTSHSSLTVRARAVLVGFICACLPASAPIAAQEQRFADIGDFRLESGETIRDCRIGYRTAGTLDAGRSNVIVVPTWASGTSEQLLGSIGPGKMLDTGKYFVVALDALGNGVSSSPSNSSAQPRMRFPQFTVGDMVRAHHAAVTKVLRLDHVKAVTGTSMGGMQTFEWMVAFPEFMDVAIPIAGSPRLAAYDIVVWRAQRDAIVNDAAWKNGDYTESPGRAIGAAFGALLLTTPEHYNRQTTRAQAIEALDRAASAPAIDANDKVRQVQAMLAMDVSRHAGGSLEQAASAVRARTLVIVASADHVVTPGPALEFAGLLGARTLVLDSTCGHLASSCQAGIVQKAVGEFLER